MLWSAALLLAGPHDSVYAQPPRGGEGLRRVQATRITSAPAVDGVLDEACWRGESAARDFLQKEPREGQDATLATEVRFCYDDKALYIGATMSIDSPEDIVSTLSRRDNAGNSERIIISLDTYRDRRTAYTIGVTASGVRFDYYHPEDAEFNRVYSFDPVWEARVTRTDKAWYAEMRIPFSQLRFVNGAPQHWGMNINRYIPARNEDTYWIMIPKSETGWSSRFGALDGIEGVHPSSRIEITPFLASDLTMRGNPDPSNPLDKRTIWRNDVGVDMKMGLGSNYTLDATINPDFGQVEADPANVNLSAYEVYYDERRPFFVEGSQLLRGRGPSYFYSRRIGAPVRLSAQAPYSEHVANTTILGAAKVSGRSESGLSIAAMSALTAREFVDTFDPTTGTYGEEELAPLSAFGVARVQQEFGRHNSMAGFMLSGVRRDLRSTQEHALLTRSAVSGGADWLLRFADGMYEFDGFAGFSHVEGDAGAISRLQSHPAHYFQRPDASHVDYDPTRTSLSGYTASLRLIKQGGEHWLWGVRATAESPEFEINDTGILQSADDIEATNYIRYRETVPSALLHRWSVEAYQATGWNFGGTRQYTNLGLTLQATTLSFWNSTLALYYAPRGNSDDLTRGGPLMQTGEAWSGSASLQNNSAEDFGWSAALSAFADEVDSWNWSFDGSVSLRAHGRWQFYAEPSYVREFNTRQYVATVAGGGIGTYGARYIFSTIDRSTLSLRLRLNYAFTPDLTLELYAEPFAASGAYLAFGELSKAGALALRRYGEDGTSIAMAEDGLSYSVVDGSERFDIPRQDFNILSFRSNVVLRWEWLRGSTLYLVWQQNRSGYELSSARIGARRLLDSFDSPGDNFLALKISLWIPVQ